MTRFRIKNSSLLRFRAKSTDVEKKLLDALLSKTGQALSRENLARELDMDGSDRTIDVQITRLRKKIEANPKSPRLIQTVRGKGYILYLEP